MTGEGGGRTKVVAPADRKRAAVSQCPGTLGGGSRDTGTPNLTCGNCSGTIADAVTN